MLYISETPEHTLFLTPNINTYVQFSLSKKTHNHLVINLLTGLIKCLEMNLLKQTDHGMQLQAITLLDE